MQLPLLMEQRLVRYAAPRIWHVKMPALPVHAARRISCKKTAVNSVTVLLALDYKRANPPRRLIRLRRATLSRTHHPWPRDRAAVPKFFTVL